MNKLECIEPNMPHYAAYFLLGWQHHHISSSRPTADKDMPINCQKPDSQSHRSPARHCCNLRCWSGIYGSYGPRHTINHERPLRHIEKFDSDELFRSILRGCPVSATWCTCCRLTIPGVACSWMNWPVMWGLMTTINPWPKIFHAHNTSISLCMETRQIHNDQD